MLIARYTGWAEDFILWDLSIHRGNAYAHALMRMNNIDTQPFSEKPTFNLDEI